MREKKDIRLFFALWPGEEVREKIDQFLKTLAANGGHFIPRHNWHMTLHFVGNTSFAERDCLHRQAQKLRSRAFDLVIDQTGFFKKPKVSWLGISETPTALVDLQKNLGKEISQCEYQPEARPYSPHITVVRKVSDKPPVMSIEPIKWPVDKFVLVESVSVPQGVRYDVVESYGLDTNR